MKSHKELMNLAAVLTVLVSSVCRMDAVRQDYSEHSGALQILDSLKTVHTRAEVSDTLPGAVPPLVLGDSVALYVCGGFGDRGLFFRPSDDILLWESQCDIR